MTTELYHHGILGQRWGIRRYQNDNGTYTNAGKIRRRVQNKLKQKDINTDRPHTDYNLDKWGSNKDDNILWVTGISGSGKSTIARQMAKNNDADLINMDLYTFKTAGKYNSEMSSSFNNFLDEKVPNWRKMQQDAYAVLTKLDRRKQKTAAEWFDTFQDALEDYGTKMHGNKKVIAEGVQILDDTLFYKNKSALKNKPMIIMDTSLEESLVSRMMRDNKSIEKLLEPDRLAQAKNFVDGKIFLANVMNAK